jgi:hypothetical protein
MIRINCYPQCCTRLYQANHKNIELGYKNLRRENPEGANDLVRFIQAIEVAMQSDSAASK